LISPSMTKQDQFKISLLIILPKLIGFVF